MYFEKAYDMFDGASAQVQNSIILVYVDSLKQQKNWNWIE